MAGYVINVGGEINNIKKMFDKGTYGTLFSSNSSMIWKTHQESTLADFLGMKAGHFIFFFAERKIFGVGRLVNLTNKYGVEDCKFLNYIESDVPIVQEEMSENLLLDSDPNSIKDRERYPRIICTFKPYPAFYDEGVDMDEVLLSNERCFKMLRVMQGVSFIKLDDSESKCLLDIMIKRLSKQHSTIETNYLENHKNICKKLTTENLFNSKNILRYAIDKKNPNLMRHEMAIEADLVYQLSNKDKFPNTREIFGEWDYVSRQVAASPFKPIIYIDKIDIFCYRYINIENELNIRDMHCVIELKKDAAGEQDIIQTLKYVDWLKDEYTGQDYSSIKAFLIAASFTEAVKEARKKHARRTYLVGRHPIRTEEWDDLKLITYEYNANSGTLEFKEVID